ncbi:MAG: aspartate carbamoyltransferase regulatory subunit [Candidatus Bathyarchaeia archaeon]
MAEGELRVKKIRDGTVIDHITAGNALAVLRILGVKGREGVVVSLLMNAPSEKLGKKDIVKIEGRELSQSEVDKIALLAPRATINIIRDYEVVDKKEVRIPRIIKEILKCPNPTCITNSREPVKTTFIVQREDPPLLKCYYCGNLVEKEMILSQF